MASASLNLVIANDLDELVWAAERIKLFLDSRGAPHKTAFAVNLALEEILINIVKYAYESGTRRNIHIDLAADDEGVGLSFRDWGKPFNPLKHPEPDFSKTIFERGDGGMGIFLTIQQSSSIVYRRREGANELEIVFRYDHEPGQGAGPSFEEPSQYPPRDEETHKPTPPDDSSPDNSSQE